MMGDKLTA